MDNRVLVVSLLVFSCIAYVQSQSLTCANITAIVDGHYRRRLQLAQGKVPNQPAASEMNDIIWDEELAAKAAKWASRNVFQHNPNQSIDSDRFITGENIYMAVAIDSSFKFNLNDALDSWFNEYKYFTYGPLFFDKYEPSILDYTQMVWSDSVYIGCGLSQAQMEGSLKYYFVCNYGPNGNYIGQTPYPSNGTASDHLICATGDCSKRYGDKC